MTENIIEHLKSNRARLNNSYAVFDWDNTCVYGDTGEHLLVFQCLNNIFELGTSDFEQLFFNIGGSKLQDLCRNEGVLTRLHRLKKDCCSLYSGPRRDSARFTALMWDFYKTVAADIGIREAYLWLLNFYCGMSREKLLSVLGTAIDYYMSKPCATVCFEGGHYPFAQGLRVKAEVQQLFAALRSLGTEIYVSTGAHQDVVTHFSGARYGYHVRPGNVLGMRMQYNGAYSGQYDYSGDYAINIMQGKTSNINNLLAARYHANPVLIGGDSDGDYYMMTSFSGLDDARMTNSYPPSTALYIVDRNLGGKIAALAKLPGTVETRIFCVPAVQQ